MRSLKRTTQEFYEIPADPNYRHSAKFRTICKWSSDHDWVDRAHAYDRYTAEQRAARREQRRIEAEDRQYDITNQILRKGLERLRAMDAAELPPSTVLSYLTEAMKHQRLVLGDATENNRVEIHEEQYAVNDAIKREADRILDDPELARLAAYYFPTDETGEADTATSGDDS